MAINPRKRRTFTHGMDDKRKKMIRYFTIFIIVLVPVLFAYQGIKNIKPKKGELNNINVATGDQPVEKSFSVVIKADGGLNFRKEPKKDAEKIGKIPDGTKLTVKKEIDGWYQIDFESKEGWIAKEFTVTEESQKETEKQNEATKDWLEFKNANFSLKYPVGWSSQDYGAVADGDATVGFSFSQLPSALGTGFFIPVDIKVSPKPRDQLEAASKALAQKTVSEIDISGVKGVKYLYTDSADSTEKTKVFLTVGSKSYVISENGGYGSELEEMLKTFKAF